MRSSPCGRRGRPARGVSFVLYVEGPSDCEILRRWAGLVSASLSETIVSSAVILGGRRPARAVEHFEGIGAKDAGLRALCVLDRDGQEPDDVADAPEGLEFFTWPRRHIESYLLVPTAMRRCLRLPPGDPRLSELLLDLPREVGDEALRALDAKRLLAAKSTLAREFGASLSATRIARCMRRSDLHPDVLELFERVTTARGPG